MADDLLSRLRPATARGVAGLPPGDVPAFGETPTGPYLDTRRRSPRWTARSALWDGDRVVATAGIYSRTLTVPGAVVPCAGITWVTVAPTHRRRGVLTAIMRRQLTEIHEHEREPVAALWASESPIYGRFGYAPAAFRGGLTGRTERLRLRPDVDLGTGASTVVPRRPTSRRRRRCTTRSAARCRATSTATSAGGTAGSRTSPTTATAPRRAASCCTPSPTARSPATRPTG